MADPIPYNITTDFSQDEAADVSGRSTVRTAMLDAEFANLESCVDSLVSAVRDVRRSDGKLQDGSVSVNSLSQEVVAMLALDANPRGIWVTDLDYLKGDLVSFTDGNGTNAFMAVVDHHSAVFATDLSGGKWMQISSSVAAGGTVSANAVSFAPAGGVGSTNVQAAILEVDSEKANKAGGNIFVGEQTFADPIHIQAPASNDEPVRLQDLEGLIPTGVMVEFGGAVAPSGWLLCNGSAVSRTTYAALFAIIGTSFGVGDNLTTFNVPDFRRRVAVGAGGVQVSGPATSIGSTGGEEKHSAIVAELPGHTHGVTDSGHTHTGTTSTDGAHTHTVSSVSGTQLVSGGVGTAPLPGTATTSSAGAHNHTFTTASGTTGVTIQTTGSGQAFNVMQPSLVVTKIIKY